VSTQYFVGSPPWGWHSHRDYVRMVSTDPDDPAVRWCLEGCSLPPDACYEDARCLFHECHYWGGIREVRALCQRWLEEMGR